MKICKKKDGGHARDRINDNEIVPSAPSIVMRRLIC